MPNKRNLTHHSIGVAVALLLAESDTVKRGFIRKLFPRGGDNGSKNGNRITKHLMRAYQILETHDYIVRKPDLSIKIVDRQELEKLVTQQLTEPNRLDKATEVLQKAFEQKEEYRDNPVWARLHQKAEAARAAIAS